MIETLESRRLFAAIVVNGTAAADSIAVTDVFGPWTKIQVNAAVGFVLDASYTSVDINGFAGDDKIVADVFKPTVIRGGAGNDYLLGGHAQDAMAGEDGNDVMYGRRGNDLMLGGNGHDRMLGGVGDDVMHGQAGNDRMAGEDGSDKMYGGDGDDYLNAGTGRDFLRGDLGKDTYYVPADGALDTIHRNAFVDVVVGVPDVFDVFVHVLPGFTRVRRRHCKAASGGRT
jgi:Ca2+-binding RTX toxin-like protein